MGYNLYIGNAVPEECDPDNYDGEYRTNWTVQGAEHPEAPRDGSPTDGTNGRWPSYSAWHDFAEDTGLHPLFYDQYAGLLRSHPGCFRLTAEHVATIQAAQCRDKAKHQGRLDWLKFWSKWALENCERPAIANS